MANYSYRCTRNRCRKRYTFPKALENYGERMPMALRRDGSCGKCGGHLAEVTHLTRRWNKRQGKCECGAIPFTHRKGTRFWLDGEWRVCVDAKDDLMAESFAAWAEYEEQQSED